MQSYEIRVLVKGGPNLVFGDLSNWMLKLMSLRKHDGSQHPSQKQKYTIICIKFSISPFAFSIECFHIPIIYLILLWYLCL